MSQKVTYTLSYLFMILVLLFFIVVAYHMGVLLYRTLPNVFIGNFGGR
ncbi:hypothetical protein J5F27_03970 [Schleiferilactobacillus harbinensis]|jgi:hypothetical protein|uniref:Uncharacterized protein n=1 Tax=Schleiferilactobacillus harbinensis TaxID=304207 RepID=A0ABU7T2A0_9LACO|nr:hypothetical protein [Schleiferilactobacillus harbinensis]MBO3091078.1 hypothetical protein [Schleiferilactobacillus harbinensis]MCI1688126.1 hypothetical protein [Schleiferilactobacillus harbinensis]MCI1783038.1 hypothetical protein [Schleiferilactobacillus harbinensis]MCI1851176.1 hypothetical protein [Schleiferilactobacillus harbinensis]GEK06505.1 hypothetical protein LHA01_17440 [Schleiferilactobacillus harbinensis]